MGGSIANAEQNLEGHFLESQAAQASKFHCYEEEEEEEEEDGRGDGGLGKEDMSCFDQSQSWHWHLRKTDVGG